ncbi:MAG: amino acid ABC transporter permease [Betaproteobacteria bacterium]|jgi:glutamate/aspartate transport system permease protein
MNYPWNWSVFLQPSADGNGTYLDTLITGFGWTIGVAFSAWALALLLGVCVGIARTVPHAGLQRAAALWVDVFRNIPLLVQIFLWYFVVPELLPAAWGSAIKQIQPPWGSFLPATFGLALFTSARVAEQVRAGLESLPRGQLQAATALGLTLPQAYRHVLLPMALRIVVPPLTSEFLNTIKNSSVALTVGLIELTAAARAIQEYSFQVFEAFTAATIIYVVLNLMVVRLMRVLEHRLAVPGFSGQALAQRS